MRRALLLAGIVLAALNLRPAIAAVSPLLGEIMADLDLTQAEGGLITTVMVVCLGATAGAGLTIPIEQAIGHGWRPAAAAALLSTAAAVLWLPQAADRARPSTSHRRLATLLRDRITWYVTGFMGLQSLTFYVVLAWLPTVFIDAGLDAERAGYLLDRARAPADRAALPRPRDGDALSAVAAVGPVLVGLLLQVSGGWTVPLTLVIGVLVAQLAVGARAGRLRFVHP